MPLRPFRRFRNFKDTRMFLVHLSLVISIIVSLIFFGIYLRSNDRIIKAVRQQTESYFDLIVRVRLWNSMHGGVYVMKNHEVVSNPYLKQTGIDPDITCSGGKVLTMRNPSLMTREISEQTQSQTGVYFHMVSLKPLNPHNMPDAFEKKALERFESGSKSAWEISGSGKEAVFRYIGPLYVRQSCLKCHGRDGYKVGDVRGGISINMPFSSAADAMYVNKVMLSGVCVLTIGLLTGIMYFMGWRMTGKLESAQKLLTEMATTDELTRLLNRREVMSRLNEEFQRARRNGERLGVIMLDLDHFKRVNDTYGHPFGDIVLKEVAVRIRSGLRVYDIAGRVGGEELFVVCPNIAEEHLKLLAERLCAAVKSSLIGDGKNMVIVTVSAGITVLSKEDIEPDILFRRADIALYRAKYEGRDRVIFL